MSRWRTRHRGATGDRGAAAVEFAIVLVVLLLIIFAIIDFGRLLFVSQSVKAASREGARAAVVQAEWGPSSTQGTVLASVTGAASSAVSMSAGSLDPPTASINGGAAYTPADDVVVCQNNDQSLALTVSVNFNWLTPVGALAGGGFGTPRKVDATTTMRCEG